MFFRHTYEVDELGESMKRTAELTFGFDSPIPATIRIAKVHPNGESPADKTRAVCVAVTEAEIEGSCGSDIVAAATESSDGKPAGFRGQSQESMKLVWAAVDRVFGPLKDIAESTTTILRWRCGLSRGPVNFVRTTSQAISNDGKTWLEISTVRALKIVFLPGARQILASAALEKDIPRYIREATEEPLGHQLFREAWSLRATHPRSALVIGVAAAEVGLKKLIGTLVPDAAWLVDEIQAPPVEKMLKKCLPSLPVKLRLAGKRIAPPDELIQTLGKAFQARNKIVHVGQAAPSEDELVTILRAVEDFLWICDGYAGFGWVSEYLSETLAKEWPSE